VRQTVAGGALGRRLKQIKPRRVPLARRHCPSCAAGQFDAPHGDVPRSLEIVDLRDFASPLLCAHRSSDVAVGYVPSFDGFETLTRVKARLSLVDGMRKHDPPMLVSQQASARRVHHVVVVDRSAMSVRDCASACRRWSKSTAFRGGSGASANQPPRAFRSWRVSGWAISSDRLEVVARWPGQDAAS